jgi:general secretion pathway protein D
MRLNRLLPLLALLAAPALLHAAGGVRAGAAAPAAPVAPPNPNAPVDKLILRDAPVDMVLDQLAEWTGRIILRPQSLQVGYITLNINKPVTKEEAIRAVESILQMNGVAVINMGEKFIKVVNTPNAGRENAELINGSVLALPPSNKIATKIFQLEFLTPQNIQAQVTQMLTSGSGQIMAFANSNFFQVTDTIANLQRVETLVNALDHPLTNLKIQPRFISLKYATASDLVQRVQALVTGGGGSIAAIATNASLSFDQRTNQLIVIATEEQFAFFKDIVDKLDIAATPSAKNRSFALKNATAATVSQTLQTLIQTAQQANQQAGQRQGGGQRGNQQGNVNQQGTNVRGAGANNAAGGAAAGGAVAAGGGAAGAAAAGGAAATAGAATTTGGSANDFSTSFGFTADARTNSIVAIGTDSDLKILGDLIDELDRPLSQVRIEVVIVDVALSDQFDSGISALGLEIRNDRLIGINGVATGFSLTGSGAVSTTSTGFGRLGQPQNWSSILGNNALSGIVNLSTTPRKGVANIISSPTIRTMHSTTASIFVGEQRPFSSGSVTAGGTGGVTTTITQLSIGISLTVSPLIGSDGTVQMLIQQGISDRAGDVTIDGNPQPIVSSRTTSATIACKSGEIIVLGGLQRSTNGKSTSMLGGVPIIGDLLGGRQTIASRNDLVFFVRPVVTDGRNDDSTNESMNEINALGKDNQQTVRKMLDIPAPAKPGDKNSPSPSTSAAPPTNAAPAPTPSRLNSRGSR